MFPPVVVVHGFTATATNYGSFGTHLASWGFVVLVGDHTDPVFAPNHEKQIATTLGYIDWLVARNGDSVSRYFQRLDVSKFGLVGHSLGGGAAVVAAARTASAGRVGAVAVMAPADLSTGFFGSPIVPETATGFWPPTLVLTGTQDLIVSPATSKATYFNAAPATSRLLRFARACHSGFADSLTLGDYNPATCDTNSEQLRRTREYLVPWMLHHLHGDARVIEWVDGTAAAEDPSIDEMAVR
jgi:pimeloyl-ACP methyl ester carboxylesterase